MMYYYICLKYRFFVSKISKTMTFNINYAKAPSLWGLGTGEYGVYPPTLPVLLFDCQPLPLPPLRDDIIYSTILFLTAYVL